MYPYLHFFYESIAYDIYNHTITETSLHQILYSTTNFLIFERHQLYFWEKTAFTQVLRNEI